MTRPSRLDPAGAVLAGVAVGLVLLPAPAPARAGEEGATPVRLWEVGTGKELLRFRGHRDPVESCAFAPDGRRVVSMSAGATLVWDVGTGKVARKFSGGRGRVAFFPDGRRVFCARTVWDAE